MNKYEIMFILKSNEEETIKNQVSELKAIITDMKGETCEIQAYNGSPIFFFCYVFLLTCNQDIAWHVNS